MHAQPLITLLLTLNQLCDAFQGCAYQTDDILHKKRGNSITNPISFKIDINTSLGVSCQSTPAWRTVRLQQGLINVPNTTHRSRLLWIWWGI